MLYIIHPIIHIVAHTDKVIVKYSKYSNTITIMDIAVLRGQD